MTELPKIIAIPPVVSRRPLDLESDLEENDHFIPKFNFKRPSPTNEAKYNKFIPPRKSSNETSPEKRQDQRLSNVKKARRKSDTSYMGLGFDDEE